METRICKYNFDGEQDTYTVSKNLTQFTSWLQREKTLALWWKNVADAMLFKW